MSPEKYETTRKLVGTQQDAADRLGVTRQLISAREKGTARITDEAALAIRELARTTKKRPKLPSDATACSAGWNAGEPPRDGKTRVIIGRLTWHDDCGGGSQPILAEVRYANCGGCSGWMGTDGLTIAADLLEALHIEWWVDLPNA